MAVAIGAGIGAVNKLEGELTGGGGTLACVGFGVGIWSVDPWRRIHNKQIRAPESNHSLHTLST